MIKVYSHVRSGTHFLMAALWYNFFKDRQELEAPAGFVGHWSKPRPEWLKMESAQKSMPFRRLFGGHPEQPRSDGIYIYRDGRDVMVSMYNVKAFHHVGKPIPPFKEWLRTPLDWYLCPSCKAAFPHARKHDFTPVEHWYRLVSNWLHGRRGGGLSIRYEDLCLHFAEKLCIIAEHFQIHNRPDRWRVPGLVGHFPRRGGVNQWTSYFDKEGLDFFFSIVPYDFEALFMPTRPIIKGK